MAMTHKQAEAIYYLSALPEWKLFIELMEDELQECHKELEWEDKNVKLIQGKITILRKIINERKSVIDFLKIE